MKVKLKKLFNNLFELIILNGNKKNDWKDNEYFDVTWRDRIDLMSKFIPEGSSVLDLGCGKMWLKDSLQMSKYIPVDYCNRGVGTLIFDFNKNEFPEDEKVDFTFVSGCLEYILDPTWFISKIQGISNNCVVSYCTTDQIPNNKTRKGLCWVNNLSRKELIQLYSDVGMQLINETLHYPNNNIFLFSK